MDYEIGGGNLPYVECRLYEGEEVICEAGAMAWMSPGIRMNTETGGLRAMFGKAVNHENLFINRYYAEEDGEITFTSAFPGSIVAIPVTDYEGVVVQKRSFLAMSMGVRSGIHVNKNIGAGLFGGEGFVMNRFTGDGVVFAEIDGSAKKYRLRDGDKIVIDPGHLAVMSETCRLDTQIIHGVRNLFFGNEGIFQAVVHGPGEVILQSMPISGTAAQLAKYMPKISFNKDHRPEQE